MKTKILMALLAGITLLAACKNSGNYASTTDTVAKEAQDSVKLVKTANMRLKVKSVHGVCKRLVLFL